MKSRADIFYDRDGPDLQGGKWTVKDILRFSREPEVNEAYEFYDFNREFILAEDDTSMNSN